MVVGRRARSSFRAAADRFYTGAVTAKLIFSGITSLDGYVADANGNFDWGFPSEEVHAFINNLQRSVGTQLMGRKLYEVMSAWETMDDPDPVMQDFAATWLASDKIVYSGTLESPSTARTVIRRNFDVDEVRDLLARSARDVVIGGPTLAAHALRTGLVDELQQFLAPAIIGGGTRWLPDDVRLDLELIDERRFESGVVFVRYRVKN
jgi:dihydrofolate reductase